VLSAARAAPVVKSAIFLYASLIDCIHIYWQRVWFKTFSGSIDVCPSVRLLFIAEIISDVYSGSTVAEVDALRSFKVPHAESKVAKLDYPEF